MAGGNEDQVALADLLDVTGHLHAPVSAHDHVDLLRVLVRMRALLGARRDVHPCNGHVPRPKVPRIHQEVRSQQAALLHGRF